MHHGWRTNKTSFQIESRPEAFATSSQKNEGGGLSQLQASDPSPSRVPELWHVHQKRQIQGTKSQIMTEKSITKNNTFGSFEV